MSPLRRIADELALDRRPPLLRDRAWWALMAAGAVLSAALWATTDADPVAERLRGALPWISVLAWQPLVEELLFRGLLQGAMLRTRTGARNWAQLSVANLAASIAFVAIHFAHHPPAWALATFVPSLALGWIRERHDSTWSAVVTHSLFNLEFFASAMAFAA